MVSVHFLLGLYLWCLPSGPAGAEIYGTQRYYSRLCFSGASVYFQLHCVRHTKGLYAQRFFLGVLESGISPVSSSSEFPSRNMPLIRSDLDDSSWQLVHEE